MTVAPKLISISGSIHAGKTTISRMLAVSMPNAFYIDGDLIATWTTVQNSFKNVPIDEKLPQIHTKIIELIDVGLRDGTDVIIDYPLSDNTRQQIIDSLKNIKFEAKWFLLKPDIAKVLAGSNTRPKLTDWEIERIHYHYEKSDLLKTAFATVIDSTKQTPEETVESIRDLII